MADGDIRLTVALDTGTVKSQIAEVKSDLRQMSQSMDGGGFQTLITQLNETIALTANLISQMSQLSATQDNISLGANIGESIQEASASTQQMASSAQQASSSLQGTASSASNVASSMEQASSSAEGFGENASNAGEESTSTFDTLADTISGNVYGAITKVGSSILSAFNLSSITNFIKKIALLTLGVYSVTALFNKFKTYVKEGIENLVQFNSEENETNQAITSLNSSLNYLKNAWASAFAPVINYVIPILTAVIDKISTVGNYVARLFGTLTGASQVIQAVKTDAEDYASSLSGVSDSADEASSSQASLNDKLASFDDLNVLGTDDSSGSGGSGGTVSTTSDASDMFEYVDVDESEFQWLLDFIDDVKKKVEESGIIEAVQNLWSALQDFADSPFVQTMEEILAILADNVFTSTLDTMTHAINMLTDALNGDLDGALEEFNSIISNLVFDPLITIAECFDDIFGTDVAGWLKDVKQSVDDIDMSELDGFTDLTTSIEDFTNSWIELKEAIKEYWDYLEETGMLDVLETAITNIFSTGFDVTLQGVASTLSIISNYVSGIADTLKFFATGDFQYLFDAFGDFNDIMVSLNLDPLIALATVFDSITGLNVAQTIRDIKEAFKWESVLATINAVRQGFEDLVVKVQEGWATIRSAFWLGVGIVAAVLELLKNAVMGAVQWLYDQAPQPIQDMVDSITQKITDLKDDLFQKWEDIKTTVYDKVTDLKDKLLSVWETLTGDTTSSFSDMGSSILDTFNDVAEKIKTPINVIITVINCLISGLESMVNGIADSLEEISLDIPDWVPEWGGKSVSFDISHISLPRIPTLAEGAVIPPNNEFMAILGDQKSGTNIEAPLDTIKQAVAEELSTQLEVLESGFASVVNAINNKNLSIGDKQIGQANARYVRQQNLIRGTNF